jgi:hypothetical protein
MANFILKKLCKYKFLLVLIILSFTFLNMTYKTRPEQIQKHLQFLHQLSRYERKVYSQDQSDGVIENLFQNLGTKDKYYVEFGVETGEECVTRHLWEKYGWDGLLMDGAGKSVDARVIRNHFFTAENIVSLFEQYNVPKNFDLLSVDIDRNDFYVTRAILEADYRPRVIALEVNRNFEVDQAYTVVYNSTARWTGDSHCGMSPLAATYLVKKYGYDVIYYESAGINMFFVQRPALIDLVSKKMGEAVTDEDIEAYLPKYKSIYRPHASLHIGSLQEFKEQDFGKKTWVKVYPDGSISEPIVGPGSQK